jgi:hypothetical protein
VFGNPLVAAPVFAVLLVVIGYQNLMVLPALRQQAGEPQLMATAQLHGATRGSRQVVEATRKQGVALTIPVEQQAGAPAATSFQVELKDASGKLVWSGTMAAGAVNADGDQQVVLALQAGKLAEGAYSVTVTGMGSQGAAGNVTQAEFELRSAAHSE